MTEGGDPQLKVCGACGRTVEIPADLSVTGEHYCRRHGDQHQKVQMVAPEHLDDEYYLEILEKKYGESVNPANYQDGGGGENHQSGERQEDTQSESSQKAVRELELVRDELLTVVDKGGDIDTVFDRIRDGLDTRIETLKDGGGGESSSNNIESDVSVKEIVEFIEDVADKMEEQYGETFTSSSRYSIKGEEFTAEEVRKSCLVVENLADRIQEVYGDER